MENRTEHIKQLITNSETNLKKIKNILETKEIAEFNNTDKETIDNFIKDIKELGKDKIKNNTYQEFCNISDDKFYLFNMGGILEKGSEILGTIKKLYRDLFLDEPIRVKFDKGGLTRKTRR